MAQYSRFDTGNSAGRTATGASTGASTGQQSKATTINPKDLQGNKKVSLTKLPMVAILHGAHAMMDGADKYGPYNWRDKPVISSIYVDAAMRHLAAWFDEREETASDSGVHHLGHAIACCSILLDAQETGNLKDDRPYDGKFSTVLKRLMAVIEKKKEEKQGLKQGYKDDTQMNPLPSQLERPLDKLAPSRYDNQGDGYKTGEEYFYGVETFENQF